MKRYCLLAFLLSCIFFLSSYAFADTTYKVKRGDSLYKISKRFKVSINEIRDKNTHVSSRIKPGTVITIPTRDKKHDAPLHESGMNRNTPMPNTDVRAQDSRVTDALYHYTVEKGDTLSEISKKFSVPVYELKEINGLKTTKLNRGQQILVKRTGPKTYIVRKGDTVYKIARRFEIDIDELKDINGLETERLKLGQKLFLEPETESAGQTSYETILSEDKIGKTDNELQEIPKPEDLGLKDKLILFAKKFIDIPYRFGGNSIFGIDCSGYVQKVYSMIGVNLPRSAREQFHEGKPVNTGELSIGDLVFFRTYASFPSHVGIYLGDNLFIHASSRGKRVTIDSLAEPFYIKRFIGAKRLLGEDTLGGG